MYYIHKTIKQNYFYNNSKHVIKLINITLINNFILLSTQLLTYQLEHLTYQ